MNDLYWSLNLDVKEKKWFIINAFKYKVKSDLFNQTIYFKVSTSKNFKCLLAIIKKTITKNNTREVPANKHVQLLNSKNNIKSIPFKKYRVNPTKSCSMNKYEQPKEQLEQSSIVSNSLLSYVMIGVWNFYTN